MSKQDISLTMDTTVFSRKLQQYSTRYRSVLRDSVRLGFIDYQSALVKEQFGGRPGLNTITGTTKRVIAQPNNTKLTWAGNVLIAVFGVPKRIFYVKIHQNGGVIKAKAGKYLKFRTTGAIRTVNKRTGGKLKRAVREKGNFVQVSQVTIPKRLHITELFNARIRQFVRLRMLKNIRSTKA